MPVRSARIATPVHAPPAARPAFHAPPPPPLGPHGDGRERHVVRVMLGPQEWMLFAPPSSAATAAVLEPLAASLASRYRPSAAAATGLLARVPVLEAGAGAAVLHTAGGETAIYAPDRHLMPAAAAQVSILLAARARIAAHGEVTVTCAPHAELPLHPAAAAATGSACRVVVCERLISPDAAEAIGLLFTARGRY